LFESPEVIGDHALFSLERAAGQQGSLLRSYQHISVHFALWYVILSLADETVQNVADFIKD